MPFKIAKLIAIMNKGFDNGARFRGQISQTNENEEYLCSLAETVVDDLTVETVSEETSNVEPPGGSP